MDIVQMIKTSKILEQQALEAGKTCAKEDRKKTMDGLVELGVSMGMSEADATRVALNSFMLGVEVGEWPTWGL
jgi:hypothetical protein